MFAVIRYIIIFVLIMLSFFFLHKNSAWFQEKIEYTKLFFKTINEDTSVTSDDVYNDVKNQDFTGNLKATTTVKSYNSTNTPVVKKDTKISVDGVIYYTNVERKKVGLPELVKSTKLNKSASLKTDDMFTGQYFEHVSPDGKTAADLVRAVSYKFQIVGENLALGIFDTDKSLVKAWMDSPTHKENILNPKYTEIGVAVGIGDYKGQRQWMAVQHFAKPLPTCTEVDVNIQQNIDLEKTALELEERELQKMAGVIESDPSTSKQYLNEYNLKVTAYNQRLNILRGVIDNFNKTIVDYNECLKK